MKYLSVFLLTLVMTNVCHAAPQKSLKRGFIKNDQGEKCWYGQEYKEQVVYFTEKHTQNIGVMTFDDPDCMSDKGLGLDANKMVINNVISRWYSHSDANFKTHPSELYSGSRLQIKGQCMQSETYSIIGILLDYKIENDSITQVVHGSSVGACMND